MVHQTKTAAILLISCWTMVCLLYYSHFNYATDKQTLKHRNSVIRKLDNYTGTEDYLINTPGCYIPNYMKTLKYVEAKAQHVTCGVRAVFIEKTNDSTILFHINETEIRKQNHNQKYECCYEYAKRSTVAGREDNHVTYSKCTKFINGTIAELKQEVIKVSCTTIPKKSKFYEDSYIILKKIYAEEKEVGKHWNVLVLGMDTVSRARILHGMPKTIEYLNQQGWLDYRGYQKVGDNTFPNLMAFLTGINVSTIYHRCAKGMGSCIDDIIWKKFQNFGYITGYGEDFLRLPDTFTPYHGFRTPPTDHYMRPLYLTGETERGNLICTHKLPSAIHALNYATDFVNAYKKDKFFGMFWLNSYSHNLQNLPSLLDRDLVNFFANLNKTGALRNTFIFFLSDHGIRFGKMRIPVESYYEERLPMFFMWAPSDFRKYYNEAYHNLQLNQNRLTTPYDLHETFLNILRLSFDTDISKAPEACPECTSLFEEKAEDRTCEDARVTQKWCSCHNLTKVDKLEPGAARSIQLVVSHIQNVSIPIKTRRCTKCSTFALKNVLRAHSHVDLVHNTTNYVIAFELSPGNVAYEASVQEYDNNFHILQPIQTISTYNVRGYCVVRPNDRVFCVCEQLKDCR